MLCSLSLFVLVFSMTQLDRFTPEWSVDNSTVNAYTLGEKDPRQRIYVYNDDGVSQASMQMCVHTSRCFSDPSKYIVDTIEADDIVNKDWEDNACMLIFPGGADSFYRVGLCDWLLRGLRMNWLAIYLI